MNQSKRHKEFRSRCKEEGRCQKCGNGKSLPTATVCAGCYAGVREWELSTLEHDKAHHTQMIGACHDMESQCAVTGLSLLALMKIGERLTVDRLDVNRGYVSDNTQLLAGSLNTAKKHLARVPTWAIRRLLRKMERVRYDRLSIQPS